MVKIICNHYWISYNMLSSCFFISAKFIGAENLDWWLLYRKRPHSTFSAKRNLTETTFSGASLGKVCLNKGNIFLQCEIQDKL